jgi:peptide-methionine (S)-S-oxide reductase
VPPAGQPAGHQAPGTRHQAPGTRHQASFRTDGVVSDEIRAYEMTGKRASVPMAAPPALENTPPERRYHQQYLDKNPGGYCGIGGTGVSCPVGVAKAEG